MRRIDSMLKGKFEEIRNYEWKVYCNPFFREIANSIEEVKELTFSEKARVVNSKPNRVAEIELKHLEGTKIFVKFFGWRNKFHYLISPFMKSKSVQSFQNALYLLSIGIHTPFPIGAFERRKKGFVEENFYLTLSLGERENVRNFLRECKDEEKKERMIEKLAKVVRKMHDGGLFHKDLTLANFLIGQDGELYIVDLNRARIKRKLSMFHRIEDISRMDLTKEARKIFLKYYLAREENKFFEWLLNARIFSKMIASKMRKLFKGR